MHQWLTLTRINNSVGFIKHKDYVSESALRYTLHFLLKTTKNCAVRGRKQEEDLIFCYCMLKVKALGYFKVKEWELGTLRVRNRGTSFY